MSNEETVKIIRTRFPPEPNGHLHLGHLKSMYLNFGYPFNLNEEDCVKKECYLRFDDTNPNAESDEFEKSIEHDLEWMGYEPDKVTHTSDYFDVLLEYAWELVRCGLAYVDPSSSKEMHEMREKKIESPARSNSIADNACLFEKMINGYYKEGAMALRLRIEREDRTNECMMDPVAYRIVKKPHYRTKDKYCIYPTYDFSHYIVDSLEGITHSFCTSEFYVRRPLSLWILDKLRLDAPVIDETNRLQTDFGTLSKRKIWEMIKSGHVSSWDDPRLLTLCGLRSHGFTPELLKAFCSTLNYTKHHDAKVMKHHFESAIRDYCNPKCSRRMMVIEPLEVEIMNYDELCEEDKVVIKRTTPLIKGEESSISHIDTIEVHLTPKVYIERGDFRFDDGVNKKYRRLAPGRQIRLKSAGIIKYVSHETKKLDEDTEIVTKVLVEFIPEDKKEGKIHGTVHWVPNSENCWTFNVVNYDSPSTASAVIVDNNAFNDAVYQFERIGYCRVIPEKRVIKKLVWLKEDRGK